MRTSSAVYLLHFNDPEAYIIPNGDWFMAEWGKSWCRQCMILRRELYPQPIDVHVERFSAENPVGFVSRLPIGVIRKDLRRMLEPWLDHFVFGKCFDDDGRLIESHSTFYSEGFVYDRFGHGTRYRQCASCGRIRSLRTTAPIYFLEYDIKGCDLVHTALCDTIVSKKVINTLDLRSVAGLAISEYKILDRPLDGVRFPTDPPDVEGEPPERS